MSGYCDECGNTICTCDEFREETLHQLVSVAELAIVTRDVCCHQAHKPSEFHVGARIQELADRAEVALRGLAQNKERGR